MKHLPTIRSNSSFRSYFAALLLAFFALSAVPAQVQACNLSSFTLNSLVPMGADTMINFTLCVGAGRTGLIAGADNNTNTFTVALYSLDSTLNILGFSPNSVASAFGGCTNQGMDLGWHPGLGMTRAIVYIDPGYYGFSVPCTMSPFACVTSTALCGNVHVQCINFSVLVNFLPDSLCVRGIEAAGNPFGGCPCSQMGSVLRQSALGLLWGDISAVEEADHIRVTWESLQEFGMGTHHLERQMNGGGFVEIAAMPGAGSNQEPVEYKYLDSKEGLQGEVNYRVRFLDENGKAEYSSVVAVKLPINGNFFLRHIFPAPAHDVVNAEFMSVTASKMDWKMIDTQGKAVAEGTANIPDGQSSLSFDLSQLRPGTYYLQCRVGNERVTRKVVKQ